MIPGQLVIDGFNTTHTDNFLEEAVAIIGEEKVNNFLNDMQSIGITYEEAVIYLQELGGKK